MRSMTVRRLVDYVLERRGDRSYAVMYRGREVGRMEIDGRGRRAWTYRAGCMYIPSATTQKRMVRRIST